MTICIMVMCGLPASGKTTLVSQFQAFTSEELTCHVVDYDKLMPPDIEADLIRDKVTQGMDLSSWKKYREEIVGCVDQLLQLITVSKQTSKPNTDIETCIDDSGQNRLSDDGKAGCEPGKEASTSPPLGGELWSHFSHCLGLGRTSTGSGGTVVVVDDNMYYRSMRYDYYQLARKYCLGFCQVFVDCSSATAMSRNKQRMLGKVDDNVIVAMATKMEAPDSSIHHWEKHSLQLSSEAKDNCSNKMQSLVRSAMCDPVMAPVEDVEGKAESRRVCSASVIHQSDQVIRKLLAGHMKCAKESGKSKEDMKSLSARLSAVKAAILNEMRSGVITFDTDVHYASKEEDSYLYTALRELFDKRTSDFS